MTQDELQELLARWRRDPIAFITEALVDPETGEPFVLYPAQERFLRHALTTTPDGRLPAEICFGASKKAGKTATAAICMIYIILVLGGPYAEGYCVANDLQQAQDRVFQAITRIIERSPLLRGSAKITGSYIEFPSTGSLITAISTDYSSAAGANPTCVTFDELWGYTSESAQRLWDELVPVPTRKVSVRLTTTYAGFDGESDLLERLYRRGLQGEEIADSLYRQPGMLMAWHHGPIAPWQTPEWLAQMREQLRPNAYTRMIDNWPVSTESTFIDMAWWDACTDKDSKPVFSAPTLPVWIGLDASTRRDSTALVAVTLSQGLLAEQIAHDRNRFAVIPDIARLQRLEDLAEQASSSPEIHLVNHRIFRPQGTELDFEATIERTLYEWARKYTICGVLFDPYQMISLAQRLGRAGFPMYPFDQTIPALTESSNNLYELLKSGSIRAYPDPELRQAIGWAVAKESTRGWRIAKEKASHHIDVVVALAFAALAAVKYGPGWFEMNQSSGSSVPADFATNFFGR